VQGRPGTGEDWWRRSHSASSRCRSTRQSSGGAPNSSRWARPGAAAPAGVADRSPRDRRLIHAWLADDTTTLAGCQPILALDMYEHAYHTDYGAKAGDFVEAYMQSIRWSNADNLYARYGSS